MDALKDIPNNIDRIETHSGMAYLQKTDIFKKTMWFSYPHAESWIPLSVQQVKEFAEMNAQGKKPQELIIPEKEEIINVAIPDYENVVGQDSLTRLDERNRKKKKRKPKRNPGKPENGQKQGPDQGTQKPKAEKKPQNNGNNQPKPKENNGNSEAGEGQKTNKRRSQNKNRRFNNKNKDNNSEG